MPERTFARWCAKGMQVKTGKYPWPEIHRWLLEQVERRGKESARPATEDEARKRKLAAEAELAELELAKQRGQLMTVEQYEEVVGAAFARVAAQLKSAPTKFAPHVVHLKTLPEAVTKLQIVADEILEDLHRGTDVPDDDDPDRDG